jgi:exosome complex RNA-binding protein Csl4
MSLDHEDMEGFYGITFVTNPTPAQVDTVVTNAEVLLESRVGTVTNTNADEAVIIMMIAERLIEQGRWMKSGGSIGMSTSAGALTKPQSKPIIWTDEIKAQVLHVYDINLDMPDAGSLFGFDDQDVTT